MTAVGNGNRVSKTARCDEQVWNAARDAARSMLSIDPTYTFADLLESALSREIQRLQDEFNDGEPWPTGNGELRRGRRLSG